MKLHSEICTQCGKYKKVWRKPPAVHACKGCYALQNNGAQPWKKAKKK